MDAISQAGGYPNVRVRLRLVRQAPSLPTRETFMRIYLGGSRFHVQDESGSHPSEILADLESPGGLGHVPRSIEEIMDIAQGWSQSGGRAERPTDLYGDLSTDEGWVSDSLRREWPLAASTLAPAAQQILASDESVRHLAAMGSMDCLGRICTEYSGVVEVQFDAQPLHVQIVRRISLPYVMLSTVRHAADPEHLLSREIVSLEEGAATEADLASPGH
jgi:hypothetical protein